MEKHSEDVREDHKQREPLDLQLGREQGVRGLPLIKLYPFLLASLALLLLSLHLKSSSVQKKKIVPPLFKFEIMMNDDANFSSNLHRLPVHAGSVLNVNCCYPFPF